MSEDPSGFQMAGAKPSGALRAMFSTLPETFESSEFNLYRYAGNDPLDKTDPMGLQAGHIRLEYQKFQPVLGSRIPQWVTVATLAINFTTSGNFSDANPANHVVAAGSLGGLKGRTDPSTSVKRDGKGLNANLKIDYWIIASRYNELERQHTFGAEGSKTKGLLEKGGYWDRMQQKWSGGIADFFAKSRLESSLSSGLKDAKAEQKGTWDQEWGDHNVSW